MADDPDPSPDRALVADRLAHTEQALARTQAALGLATSVLDAMSDAVGLLDAEDRFVYVNKALDKAYAALTRGAWHPRMTLREVVAAQVAAGRNHPQLLRLMTDEGLEEALRNPKGSRSEVALADGRYLESIYRPLRDGRTLVVHRVISELKQRQLDLERAHREIDRARREAERAQRTLNDVLDNMPDAIALVGEDQRVLYCNRAVASILGVPGERLKEGGSLASFGLPETDFVLTAGAQDGQDGRCEGPTGADRYIEFNAHALGDQRRLLIWRDITELRERQAELEQARDAAEAANKAKSTFLAIMSHEIRTPMNGVVGTAELLEREALDPRLKRMVATVRSSASALLRIIDDVLDFSKIEAGRMELEEMPFPLRAVIEGTCETLSVQAERKGLTLVPMIDPATPDLVEGDATRVRQILFNLIGNAIKFTDTGRIEVAVRPLSVVGGRSRVALSVTDSGIGMSEREAARLFQPFSQADSSTTRRYGGTGLGLSIVRRLAELMGGEATVRSTPGKGSTFTVTLDLALARAAPAAPTIRPTGAAAGHEALAGRLLAVDDYPGNLEVLADQLEILGVPVDMAGSGLEALALWRTQRYALLLTDIHMPNMDGFELTRQIRAEEALSANRARIPIVALTANALKGEADRCLAAGMDGYLSKPLTLDRLRAAVERWMRPSVAIPTRAPSEGRDRPLDPPTAPPIDRAVLAGLFGDDPGIVDRILGRFASDGGGLVAELAMADDQHRLADIAHKLKGAARAAGAARLGDLAEAVERSGLKADVAPLVAEWQRVSEALGRGSPDG
jgi:signal transduction histidine kinase/DNA-binding NarL/FixJ family response regulator